MEGLRRASAAVVGVAESDLGQVAEGLSPIDLMAQGVQRALGDCGLLLKDVDGVFCATSQSRLSALALCEYLGIDPPFLGSTIVGGSSFEYHVAHAMAAIAAGETQDFVKPLTDPDLDTCRVLKGWDDILIRLN